MNKCSLAVLCIGLAVVVGGCGAPGATPTALPSAAATPTQPVMTSPAPGTATVAALTTNCELLSSKDAASFFSTAEVEGPTHSLNVVNDPVFTTQPISATESSCIFYVFHLPGSKDMKLLQITYWVDLPDQVTASAWAQAWVDATAAVTQTVSGIGEVAFFHDGRLSFKQASTYFTVEVIGTDLQTDTRAGLAQQREIEKAVAQDMLGRLN
jgi:hypothetical protein